MSGCRKSSPGLAAKPAAPNVLMSARTLIGKQRTVASLPDGEPRARWFDSPELAPQKQPSARAWVGGYWHSARPRPARSRRTRLLTLFLDPKIDFTGCNGTSGRMMRADRTGYHIVAVVEHRLRKLLRFSLSRESLGLSRSPTEFPLFRDCRRNKPAIDIHLGVPMYRACCKFLWDSAPRTLAASRVVNFQPGMMIL
jgi:hypothetical protein